MVWLAIDGAGAIHGPFSSLAGKGGYVFHAAEKVHPEPWTLVLVEDAKGDERPFKQVALDALLLATERVRA